MPPAQVFELEGLRRDRGAEAERLRAFLRDSGTALEERNRGPGPGDAIPMHECLSPLVPGGALNHGTIIALPPRAEPKPDFGSHPLVRWKRFSYALRGGVPENSFHLHEGQSWADLRSVWSPRSR